MTSMPMIHPDYKADPKDAGHVSAFMYKSGDMKKAESQFWQAFPNLNGQNPWEMYMEGGYHTMLRDPSRWNLVELRRISDLRNRLEFRPKVSRLNLGLDRVNRSDVPGSSGEDGVRQEIQQSGAQQIQVSPTTSVRVRK
jgi:hypothetical protein